MDNGTGNPSPSVPIPTLNKTTFEPLVVPSLADQSPYNYVPSRTTAIMFLAFYGLSTRQSSLVIQLPDKFVLKPILQCCIWAKPRGIACGGSSQRPVSVDL